jgi:hypothetical protein
MLDRETEEHWQAVKESYPDAVVFHEFGGSFIVRGRDTEVLRKEFDIDSGSTWFGFDDGLASVYMTELASRGYDVVRASNGQVSRVRPPTDHRKEVERQRARSRFLALDPTLLFDEGEIDRLAGDKWLRRRGYEELFDIFKRWLQTGDWRSLRDYGELYVYQVGDWYEVDLELTSMLEGHVLLLAKAALATRRKLPCRVVEPKRRRERRSGRRPPEPIALPEKAPRLGQLSFADITEGWAG